MSRSLSLDKAILQDTQNVINEWDGADPVWKSFTPHAFMQVGLLAALSLQSRNMTPRSGGGCYSCWANGPLAPLCALTLPYYPSVFSFFFSFSLFLIFVFFFFF